MAIYTVIKDGKVVNIIKGPESLTIQGLTLIDITNLDPQPKKGWFYTDESFIEPVSVTFNDGKKAGEYRKKRELLKMSTSKFHRLLIQEII